MTIPGIEILWTPIHMNDAVIKHSLASSAADDFLKTSNDHEKMPTVGKSPLCHNVLISLLNEEFLYVCLDVVKFVFYICKISV